MASLSYARRLLVHSLQSKISKLPIGGKDDKFPAWLETVADYDSEIVSTEYHHERMYEL